MIQWLHRLACLVAFLCLATGLASAAPPTVSLDLVSPVATSTPGDYTTFELRYNVVGADLSKVAITWDLPFGFLPVGAAAAGDFAVTCDPQDSDLFDWTCTWTATSILVPGGGVSGALPVGVKFLRWMFADGTVVSTDATLSADWSDGMTTGTTGPHLGSESVILEGTAQPLLHIDWHQQRPTGFGFIDGVPGKTSLVNVQPANVGTIGVEPGSTVTVDLPPDARVIRFMNHASDVVLTSALGSLGPAVVQLGGRVGVNRVSANPFPYVNENMFAAFTLVIWRPCAADPYLPSERIEASWSGAIQGSPSGVLATFEAAPHDTLTSPRPEDVCVAPATLSWSGSSPRVGPGQLGNFRLSARPPSVVTAANDVFFSVPVPSGMVVERHPRFLDEDTLDTGSVYLCSVAGDTAPFTAAEFALVRASACVLSDGSSPLPAGLTHIVATRDAWGEPVPGGNLLWNSLSLDAPMYLATCGDAAIHIDAYASYREPGGPLVELSATHTPTVQLLSQPTWYNASNPATATRGSTQTLSFFPNATASSAPLLNPEIRVPIPPGVTVLDVHVVSPGRYACETAPPLADDWYLDGNTLVVPTGDSGSPWYLNATTCVCAPAGDMQLQLELYFDAAHPFENGDVLAFVASIDADNRDPVYAPPPFPVSVAMLVPPEMRLSIEPACDPSPAAYPSFRIGWANSGGVPLADAEAVFDIPAGTTLVDVTSASTTTCFDGSTWTTCTASAQRVRVSLPTLAPHTSGSMLVRLDTASPPGTLIYGSGSLTTSSGLAPIDASPLNPVIVGTCPGQLDLQVWWDDTHPGALDPGELPAAGWSAIVQHTITGDSVTVALGPSGFVSTPLAPGVYTLTFVPPGDLDASWTVLQPPPATVTIVATQTTYVGIGVSCACSDEDACTTDMCSRAGVCSYPEVPGCSVCEPEPGCPAEGGRIFGEVTTAAGPRSFRCTFVPGGEPVCEVERDGNGAPILSGGHPVLALFDDLVCE